MRVLKITALLGVAAFPICTLGAGFAGLEGGNFSYDYSSGSGSRDEDGSYLGFRAGVVEESRRIYGTVSVPDMEDDDETITWLTGSYDYLFMAGQRLQPFIGGNIGYYSHSIETSTTDHQITAFTFGVEGGIQYTVGNLLLEAGLRGATGPSSDDDIDSIDVTVDSLQQFYGSVNLMF